MIPVAVYHRDYAASLRPTADRPLSKYGYLRDLLTTDLNWPEGRILAPARAAPGLIAAAHPLDYVERVLNAALTRAETRAIGYPATAHLANRSRRAVGGTLLAARLALDEGVALNCAGGSHHAGPAGGAGYCVFNDVAVAALALLAEGTVRSISVLDCDVHQGDGTARILAGHPGAVTVSLHAARNFPADKATSTHDIALADGVGDQGYLEALEHAIEAALAPGPDLLFYNAGVDIVAGDRLGRLAVSAEGLARREARVLSAARARGVPVACVLGGGYGLDPVEVARRHLPLFQAALDPAALDPAVLDPAVLDPSASDPLV